MALYLFNISVDTSDPHPDYIPEDLSINDQESIIEIVVEKILGFEDAIQEHDDADAPGQTKKRPLKIDLACYLWATSSLFEQDIPHKKSPFMEYNSSLPAGYTQLFTPPPQKICFSL